MPRNHDLLIAASTIWVVVTAVLVMFMQAGFAFLEAGLTRMKNAAHIAGKNVLIFGICSLVYWAVGFGLAFGGGGSLIGTEGFFPSVDTLTAVGQAPFDGRLKISECDPKMAEHLPGGGDSVRVGAHRVVRDSAKLRRSRSSTTPVGITSRRSSDGHAAIRTGSPGTNPTRRRAGLGSLIVPDPATPCCPATRTAKIIIPVVMARSSRTSDVQASAASRPRIEIRPEGSGRAMSNISVLDGRGGPASSANGMGSGLGLWATVGMSAPTTCSS